MKSENKPEEDDVETEILKSAVPGREVYGLRSTATMYVRALHIFDLFMDVKQIIG